jgi:S-adenosylmethionine:tRNA ribosyltransferase-isomerase
VEDVFYNLNEHLPADSLLIFNNTKVVEARILFEKSSGSIIELFCLEPSDEYPDITSAMLQKEKVIWKCLVGGAKKWKNEPLEKTIFTGTDEIKLVAKKIKKTADYFLIEFRWSDASFTFAEILHIAGSVPLPPYLDRTAEESDKERYQTIYAKYEGSVAAPTAGLHFTERLFEKLQQKKIDTDFVTLHVGAGTFKPVKSETIDAHEMHAEFFEVRKELLEHLLAHPEKNIIAVGTTSLRTLESLYWLGVKTQNEPQITPEQLHLEQWEAYEIEDKNQRSETAFRSLLNWMNKHDVELLFAKTQIIITPGYDLKVADALITNFHQPHSTLLLLVAAIVFDDWRKIYEYALNNDFRFLSYGDGSLLWKRSA